MKNQTSQEPFFISYPVFWKNIPTVIPRTTCSSGWPPGPLRTRSILAGPGHNFSNILMWVRAEGNAKTATVRTPDGGNWFGEPWVAIWGSETRNWHNYRKINYFSFVKIENDLINRKKEIIRYNRLSIVNRPDFKHLLYVFWLHDRPPAWKKLCPLFPTKWIVQLKISVRGHIWSLNSGQMTSGRGVWTAL